jgi:hypothetical protein
MRTGDAIELQLRLLSISPLASVLLAGCDIDDHQGAGHQWMVLEVCIGTPLRTR